MGTKCASTYTNIFMNIFEETHIYPLIEQNMQLHSRYSDDVFILTVSDNKLQQFISKINGLDPFIKFDFKYSKTQRRFLEITILCIKVID